VCKSLLNRTSVTMETNINIGNMLLHAKIKPMTSPKGKQRIVAGQHCRLWQVIIICEQQLKPSILSLSKGAPV